jgi:CRP-like cAMP-binding protein
MTSLREDAGDEQTEERSDGARRPRGRRLDRAPNTACRVQALLARYGEPEASHRTLPRVSQETLAEMVGTTRSRVNFFMNKFRKLGFIEYNGGWKINNSLLSVVLRD